MQRRLRLGVPGYLPDPPPSRSAAHKLAGEIRTSVADMTLLRDTFD
jgi:hypothetical protein